MPFRQKKTFFKRDDKNKNLSTLDQIVCIKLKPNPDENVYLGKRDKNKKSRERCGYFKCNLLQRVFKTRTHHNTQKEAFVAAMKYMIAIAKVMGLFPIGEKKISNKRWPVFSWRYAYCIFMNIFQIVVTFHCFQDLLSTTITIHKLGYFSFYLMTWISSIYFLRLSTKWNNLIKELKVVDLSEYIDQNIDRKCNFALIVLLGFAFVEHSLSITLKWTYAVECLSNGTEFFKPFITYSFYWIINRNVPYSVGFGIFLVVQNIIVTMIASYVHLFIICISLYLSSILEQINKVILSKEGQYLPVSHWRKLREDYNKASRLVRCFDDVINSIVLISFASSLLFECAQLSFFIANGVRPKTCHNPYSKEFDRHKSGTFYPYVYATFSLYSVTFLILRSLAVPLIASRIHSESLVAVPVLYNVPSPTFSIEIERFLQQIHGSKIALTGHNFFYVTKDVILSVVGTIVTYELVLLQFEKSNE